MQLVRWLQKSHKNYSLSRKDLFWLMKIILLQRTGLQVIATILPESPCTLSLALEAISCRCLCVHMGREREEPWQLLGGTSHSCSATHCFSCSSVELLMCSQLFFYLFHRKHFDNLGNYVPLPTGLPKKRALNVTVTCLWPLSLTEQASLKL